MFLSLFRVDYIIAPLKVLQSLKDSVTAPGEKYSFVRRLSPQSASLYNFSDEEVCILLKVAFLVFILDFGRYQSLQKDGLVA